MFRNKLSQAAVTDHCILHRAGLTEAGAHDAAANYPATCEAALNLVKHLTTRMKRIDACINDCVLFVDRHAHSRVCPKCEEPRFHADGKQARRQFFYMPIETLVRELYSNPRTSRLSEYFDKAFADGAASEFFHDVATGKIIQEVVGQYLRGEVNARDIVALLISFDGVQVSRSVPA